MTDCGENEIKSEEETLCQYFPLIIASLSLPLFRLPLRETEAKIAVLESVFIWRIQYIHPPSNNSPRKPIRTPRPRPRPAGVVSVFRALFRSSFVLITRSGTSETEKERERGGGKKARKKGRTLRIWRCQV